MSDPVLGVRLRRRREAGIDGEEVPAPVVDRRRHVGVGMRDLADDPPRRETVPQTHDRDQVSVLGRRRAAGRRAGSFSDVTVAPPRSISSVTPGG